MTETDNQDWKYRWNAFLSTGRYDGIEPPEDGYQIGDVVTGRDGITYLVKGFNNHGEVILGLDRDADGKERIFSLADIRPGSTVGQEMIAAGIIQILQDRSIQVEAGHHPQSKSNMN